MTGAGSTFHVDLRGVVDLLSHHLYTSPRVYLRELLQNSVDAITARCEEEPDAPRRVRVVPADLSPDGCLHVEDTGIGLDEDGIRGVLATIGASTKRDALGLARESFLGQFGIGLLSCFLVTDEIRVTTRRAGSDDTWLWVGRDDGTYAVSRSPEPRDEPGTDVAIRPRGSAADLLSAEVVERLATSFAAYLRIDLVVKTASGPVPVAGRALPWEEGEGAARRAAATQWCETGLGFTPLDVVDLADPAAGVRGVAYVLPHSSAARGTHRLYAKRMLVGDAVPDVLPEWAFFVRAVLDADGLGLTASRESLHDDEALHETRARLGEQLKRWLLRMARTDRARADDFFRVHHLAAKAAATTDDDMLEVVAELLPWETTLGTMTLAEFSAVDRVVSYTDRVEDYQQVAAIARAEDIAVLNAGYAYDRALLDRWVPRRSAGSLTGSTAGCSAPPGWSRAASSPSTSPTGSPRRPRRRRPPSRRCSTSPGRCSAGPAPCRWCGRSAPSRCTPCCSSVATPTVNATGWRSPRRPGARGPTRSTPSPSRMPCPASC